MESGYEIIKRLRKGKIIKCADCKKDIISLTQKMFRLLVNFDAINAIAC